jgi:hypothetical protein
LKFLKANNLLYAAAFLPPLASQHYQQKSRVAMVDFDLQDMVPISLRIHHKIFARINNVHIRCVQAVAATLEPHLLIRDFRVGVYMGDNASELGLFQGSTM